MVNSNAFHPVKFIEEVKARPGLYSSEHPIDRTAKLELWKEVGAALFPEWCTYSKATAYDRVLQLQKKWRSIRDAYNRELRFRKAEKEEGNRLRKVYRYFGRLTFLGGLDEDTSSVNNKESEEQDDDGEDEKFLYPLHELEYKDDDCEDEERSATPPLKKIKKRKRKRESSGSIQAAEEFEMPMPIFTSEITDNDNDTDRQFLMSFAPEMRQLPVHIKMWARAQIANIMQEAVSSQINNTVPRSSFEPRISIKRQRNDVSE